MTSIPSIPPLLNTTPPPIDFGEEEEDDDTALPCSLTLDDECDGDYNSLKGISQSNFDYGTSSDVLSLPSTPIQLEYNFFEPINNYTDIPEFSNVADKMTKPVEAFNLAVSCHTKLESSSPPPLELDNKATKKKDKEYEEEDIQDPGNGEMEEDFSVTLNEDNISLPSLKLETLSINSEKLSTCSNSWSTPMLLDEHESNAIAVNRNAIAAITLEDLIDDSSDDENHSPKKSQKHFCYENAEDFFSIQTLNEEVQVVENSIQHEEESTYSNLYEIRSINDLPTEEGAEYGSDETVDNFATNFTNFSHLQTTFERSDKKNVITKEKQEGEPKDLLQKNLEVSEEDDFDDFQNFTITLKTCNGDIESGKIEKEAELENISESNSMVNTPDINEAEESEDEFGDFSNAPAPLVPTVVSNQMIKMPTEMNGNKLNEKFKQMLEVIFPKPHGPSVVAPSKSPAINNKELAAANSIKFKLDAIDTAKALDYQWTKSEVRHSLIRAIGIDSRNILYGERWSASIPRFAANLTFGPLEPQKLQQQNLHGSLVSDKTLCKAAPKILNKVKSDIPEVEFDWNSSGLVNPLDGPKEVSHSGETETLYKTQSGTINTSIDQQPSHTNVSSAIGGICKPTDVVNINPAPASPTITDTTTATAISSVISADSIGNGIKNNGSKIDLITSYQIASEVNTVLTKQITTTTRTSYPIETTISPLISALFNRNAIFEKDFQTDIAETNCKGEAVSEIEYNEVISTSTFAGPLKETHIYTPSKNDAAPEKSNNTIIKNNAIDFDYEIAAAGIIIDDKVVKKEYRDIEYNPGFDLELNKIPTSNYFPSSDDSLKACGVLFGVPNERGENVEHKNELNTGSTICSQSDNDVEAEEEFSEFQCVPPPPAPPQILFNTVFEETALPSLQTTALMLSKDIVAKNNNSNRESSSSTPTIVRPEMILSPSILLPQAMSLENTKSTIEWGDEVVSINPEELARIEELFPQPKTDAIKSKKLTPQRINGCHQQGKSQHSHNSLSISATIAQKEMQVDDDDWSEFISVPLAESATLKSPKKSISQTQSVTPASNNNLVHLPIHAEIQQEHLTDAEKRQEIKKTEVPVTGEDEWSDFVSSLPTSPPTTHRSLPQFNSAAWQNANFYNNPFSLYHNPRYTNVLPKLQSCGNNNNDNSFNKYFQERQQQHHRQLQQQQELELKQKIDIMQDFSTAPPSVHTCSVNQTSVSHNTNTQFQVGSAKIAPTISLIPDLGFIAPAAPMHTAFINTLPKSSFNSKK